MNYIEKVFWMKAYFKRQMKKHRFCIVCEKWIEPKQVVRDETCIEICPLCKDDLAFQNQEPPF